jgi:hypothetical protein
MLRLPPASVNISRVTGYDSVGGGGASQELPTYATRDQDGETRDLRHAHGGTSYTVVSSSDARSQSVPQVSMGTASLRGNIEVGAQVADSGEPQNALERGEGRVKRAWSESQVGPQDRAMSLLDSALGMTPTNEPPPPQQRRATVPTASRKRISDIMSSIGVANTSASTLGPAESAFLDAVVPEKDVGLLSRLAAASQRHVPVQAETLFVPHFRKDGYVLGEMYGGITLNALAVAMVSSGHRIPTQVARRFVIDLNAADGFEFVEYEWFQGGFLVIAVHTIALNGRYKGHSTIFAPSSDVNAPATPSQVLMRFGFEDVRSCQQCGIPMPCRCPVALPANILQRADSFSWTHWTSILEHLRTGSTLTNGTFTVSASIGDMQVTRSCLVSREFTQREGISGRANILRRRYAASIFSKHSHPTVDDQLVGSYARDQIEDIAKPTENLDGIDLSRSPPDGEHLVIGSFPDFRRGILKQTVESGKGSDDATHEGAPRQAHPQDAGAPVRNQLALRSRSAGKKCYYCDCGFAFSHRGHYNAHQRAVHMK